MTAHGSNVIIPIIFCQPREMLRRAQKNTPPGDLTPRLVVVLVFEQAGNSSTWLGRCRLLPAPMKSPIKLQRGAHGAPYRVVVVSRRGGPVTTIRCGPAAGHPAAGFATLGKARIDTLIIPGGGGVQARRERGSQRSSGCAARRASVCRIASVCTGAFLLAEAGVLAGRRATTHWQFLRPAGCSSTPTSKSSADPIYVRDGRIWTSAGITAGIDLSLALVGGTSWSAKSRWLVARHLVVFLNRPGGQSQFSAPLEAQAAAAVGNAPNHFAPLHDWIAENVAGDLRVERLAEQAGMSPRRLRADLCGEDGRHAGAHGGAHPRRGGSPRPRRKRSTDQTDRGALRLRPGGKIAPRLRAAGRHHAGGIPAAILGASTLS